MENAKKPISSNKKENDRLKYNPKTGRLAFKRVYQQKIAPLLNKYEQERISTLRSCIIVCAILIILGIFVLVLEVKAGFRRPIIGAIILTSAFLFWGNRKKRFENKIKNEIMSTACACIGNIKWNDFYDCEKEFIQEIGVVDRFDYDDYDDYFCGSYKNVNIEVIEADYSRRCGKNTVTIFDGAIIVLDLNKNFTGRTIITEKGTRSTQERNLTKTSLEDPEFNKRYKVFTNDEVEARYLITPSFMERLKNIKNVFNARYVTCSFYQGKLFIALYTYKDLFALGSLTKNVNDPEPYYQMFDEIYSIMKLINHFKLDEKTGL